MKKIGIAGLGLLGASLGMALRGKNVERIGWTRRKEVRRYALENNIVDSVTETPLELFRQSDLLILCIPIPEILAFIRQYGPFLKPGGILTDIGSVKCAVEQAALASGVRFIGSHPMAGTEKSGPEAAFPEMYRDADVFVVPPSGAAEKDIAEVESFWRMIGTRTTRIDAKAHDALVAHTSHAAHVIAAALTLSILDERDPETRRRHFSGCATGFRDTSRIASSSPLMWREIIEHNTPAVLSALKDFDLRLQDMIAGIEKGDFDSFQDSFAKGKALRDEWLKYKNY